MEEKILIPRTEVEKDAEEEERERERDSVDNLFHARVASHYSSDGWGSLLATVQSKSSYLKILEVGD